MESIGQLTGGIAHDFNNILAAIMGYTSLAIERCVGEPEGNLAKYLSEVYKAGGRGRDLIKQMLAFSRQESGKRQRLAPASVVEESVSLLRSTIPTSIDVRVQIGEVADIEIDPVQLQQVVMNLVINARDALDGKGRIEVVLRQSESQSPCSACHENFAGPHVVLEVRDDGDGIPPEVLDRIFEPFYSTKEVGKGTGMGLSMVHGIIHASGGHIVVDSQAGEGTSMQLHFPAVAASETEAEVVQQQAMDHIQLDDAPLGRVLVVDDEKSLASLLKELLEMRGYRVTCFTDSKEARRVFESNPGAFDLMITDQTMPNFTGLELARDFSATRPDLPIILCTGFGDNLTEDGMQQHGVTAIFRKPANSDELLSAA